MKLLEPVRIGDLELPNRVIMAPMTRCRAEPGTGIPTDLMAEYYRQRAGAGLIISEGVPVSPRGVGYENIPGIYTSEQVQGWKKVTRAVHRAGGRIFAQLWHAGSITHPDFHGGELPLSASAVNPDIPVRTPEGRKKSVAPKAMTEEDIRQTVADFRNAAVRAMEAGFDGIEIHSSNGYLFHQFFSCSTNLREDHYGGSVENRTRLFWEVLNEITANVPARKVAARLNPMYHGRAGIFLDEESLPTFEYLTSGLNGYKLAYLHLSRPFFPVESPLLIEDVPGHFRDIYYGHLMVNGMYDAESGEAEVKSEIADSIAFGIPFIGNPDLAERIRHGHPWAEADKYKYYLGGAEGYTTYPPFQK